MQFTKTRKLRIVTALILLFSMFSVPMFSTTSLGHASADTLRAEAKASPILVLFVGATTVGAGYPVDIKAQLFGATSDVSGTITFYAATNSGCPNSLALQVGSVKVTSWEVKGDIVINSPGLYWVSGVYSGDSKNSGATSSCYELLVLALSTPEFPLGSLVAIVSPMLAIAAYAILRRKRLV
jgi:hypothetical protein